MSRWYRAYEGTVTDAKLGEAALVAGCSRSVAIAAWHCILESCAASQQGGQYDTTPRRVAVILSEPIATIESLFSAFAELGMIDGNAVKAWKQRQFESDTSTERSRKHRATKRNGDATLQEREATPPETETESDTEREKNARTQESDHWQVCQDILDNRAADLDQWEIDFLISIKPKSALSKAQAESLKGIQAKLGPRTGKPHALPSVKRGTPAYDAWIAHYRARNGGRATFHEGRDTLTVPSEFPPHEAAA